LSDRKAVGVGGEEKPILTLGALTNGVDSRAKGLCAPVAAASVLVVEIGVVAEVAADEVRVGVLKASFEIGARSPEENREDR